jgi:hypothetical protein
MSPRRAKKPSKLDVGALGSLLRSQNGIVSRRQVLDLGGSDADIAVRLNRREWARVHPGVYVDHTGPLTWEQRAWAAVQARWPAALSRESAVRAHGLRAAGSSSETSKVQLVISATRSVDPLDGARIERIKDFDDVANLTLHPPRVRLEHALLNVAGNRGQDGAVAVLADACQQGRTTPGRLAEVLSSMPRLRHRALLLEILRDVTTGAYSAMERRYLRRVERAHGLPGAGRQRPARVGDRSAYRDVEYAEQLTVVQLDGRLGHELSVDRWDDLDRDIAAAEDQLMTLRVGWRQVLSPCRLAMAIGRILAARGWEGRPVPCSPGCPVADDEGCSG